MNTIMKLLTVALAAIAMGMLSSCGSSPAAVDTTIPGPIEIGNK